MLQDVRLAFRTLGRARGFAAAAVLTLGVAMGGSTIVYAIVDALLLRPLPFGARSGRLITLHSTHPSQAQDWDDSLLSAPDLLDIADSSRSHSCSPSSTPAAPGRSSLTIREAG